MTDLLLQAAQVLRQAQRIVCLTGAGVSAESGVATFRDALTGLWSNFDPEQLASEAGFAANPGLVWRWYMERLQTVERVQPNPGHTALAQLEATAPHFVLFTQNVDDLHERAGSRNVHHLHGSITRFCCTSCREEHYLQADERRQPLPPHCLYCNGLVRPAVVWFGEMLPYAILKEAWYAVEHCDLLLVVGTSGVVYPAAQLPFTAKQYGATVIDINPEPTPISEMADLYLPGRSGEILPQVIEAMVGGGD